jgi:hypothetical protein
MALRIFLAPPPHPCVDGAGGDLALLCCDAMADDFFEPLLTYADAKEAMAQLDLKPTPRTKRAKRKPRPSAA